MNKTIDNFNQYSREQGIAILNSVIALCEKYPKAVYSTDTLCHYYDGKVTDGPGTEGCIVGQSIVACGFDGPIYNQQGIADLCADSDIGKRLSYIQDMQDRGATWGQCLKSYRQKYPTDPK